MVIGIVLGGESFRQQPFGGISRSTVQIHRALARYGTPTALGFSMGQSKFVEASDRPVGRPRPAWLKFRGSDVAVAHIGSHFDRRLARQYGDWFYLRTYYGPRSVASRQPSGVMVYDMIHEMLPESFGNDRISSRRVRALINSKRQNILESDLTIAISEFTRQQILDRINVEPDRVRTVYLGVAEPPVAGANELLGCPPKFVLYVGARTGYKNFERSASALASRFDLRDVEMVCFGGGRFGEIEQRMIADLDLTGRVTQLGGTDAILDELYRRALLLVYPSILEGFGLPVLEAMARGCPVAASTGGAIPEIAGNGAELFDPFDIEAMALSMARIIYDSARRAELVALGRHRAELFSWQRSAETLTTCVASI